MCLSEILNTQTGRDGDLALTRPAANLVHASVLLVDPGINRRGRLKAGGLGERSRAGQRTEARSSPPWRRLPSQAQQTTNSFWVDLMTHLGHSPSPASNKQLTTSEERDTRITSHRSSGLISFWDFLQDYTVEQSTFVVISLRTSIILQSTPLNVQLALLVTHLRFAQRHRRRHHR